MEDGSESYDHAREVVGDLLVQRRLDRHPGPEAFLRFLGQGAAVRNIRLDFESWRNDRRSQQAMRKLAEKVAHDISCGAAAVSAGLRGNGRSVSG